LQIARHVFGHGDLEGGDVLSERTTADSLLDRNLKKLPTSRLNEPIALLAIMDTLLARSIVGRIPRSKAVAKAV
jgi:hypothetical protein